VVDVVARAPHDSIGVAVRRIPFTSDTPLISVTQRVRHDEGVDRVLRDWRFDFGRERILELASNQFWRGETDLPLAESLAVANGWSLPALGSA
jgi:hypothetical protein